MDHASRRRSFALVVTLAVLSVACSRGGGGRGGGGTDGPPVAPGGGVPRIAGNPTTPVDLLEAYAWLFAGSGAPQQGVAVGTITRDRIALVHGLVTDEAGQPLPGVRVEVAGRPEFGHTSTASDGRWLLALNGGDEVAVRFTRAGRAPAQRQARVGWRGQHGVEPVALVPRATTATAVVGGASTSTLVVGDVSDDQDGRRRALLYVPPTTRADAVLPDGQLQPLPTFTVRSTEFTVGERGPERMPAGFLGNIAYTYAVEYVCDEAEALGAVSVRFSQPVVHYVENFLDFAVGSPVPTGFFDRTRQTWVPAGDGLVVKVLAVDAGRAVLDVLGLGAPASAAQLAALGISDDERQRIASVHDAGAELWRVRLEHFTPWDCNWPYGPPATAEAPSLPVPGNGEVFDAESEDQDANCGSIILVQDQVLMEAIEVPGTGMRLVYRSDRAPGYRSRTRVPLTGETLPPDLKRIDFVADVGGRRFTESFPPAPRLVHEFVWDGRDGRGSLLQGRQRARFSVGYVYDATYQEPANLQQSFAQFSGVPMTGNRARQQITLWQHMDGMVGGFDARGLSLGGWTLDAHHVYDAEARLLLRGDGSTEGRKLLGGGLVDTFAGQAGVAGFLDGPAREARLSGPTDVRVAPDGSVWFLESVFPPFGTGYGALRRIGRDGVVTTIAGGDAAGFSGDGGPAADARLRAPHQFDFAPDGSVWIADTNNHCIRRIGTDGIIRTVAGQGGVAGFAGDGGPATAALLRRPMGIAVARDGSVYFTDFVNHRVRRIGTDGTITTILGTGQPGLTGDGGPAALARTNWPDGIAVDDDGNVYFTQVGAPCVRCIGVDGVVRRIAGTGEVGNTGDGGPALQARIREPNGLAIGRDGSLFFCQYDLASIRRVAPDGVITTFFGRAGEEGFGGDGGLPSQARCRGPNAICQAPDGTFYIAESENHVIRRIQPGWPGFGLDDKVVVEADGSVLHVFDRNGRHLRTESSITTERLLGFDYDDAGRLVRAVHEAGTVVIERAADGAPSAIVSPGGKRTTLTIDARGLLTRLQTPDGRALEFAYDDAGLLLRLRFADGSEQTFAYDEHGRLVRDTDAGGRTQQLARTVAWDREEITITTGANRVRSYVTQPGAQPGEEVRIDTTCCERTEISLAADGTVEERAQDGTIVRQTFREDAVFGSEVRIPDTRTVVVPAAPNGSPTTVTTQFVQQATLADPNDPRSLTAMTTTTTVQGRVWRQELDRTAGTLLQISPEGRSLLTELDDRLRVVRQQVLGGPPIDWIYDSLGRLAATEQRLGGVVRRMTFAYDADGNLVRVVDPNGAAMDLTRDAADRLIRIGSSGGAAADLRYDSASRLRAVVPPGRSEHRLERDAAGRMLAYVPPAGEAVRFLRDADGSPTSIDLAGLQSLGISYEPGSSRLVAMTIGAPRTPGSIVFDYHPTSGLLSQASTPEGVVVQLAYRGGLPRQVTTQIPGTAPPLVTIGYDARLMVGTLAVGAHGFAHTYDDDGLLVQVGTQSLVRDIATGFLEVRALGQVSVATDHGIDGFPELDRVQAEFGGVVLWQQSLERDVGARIVRSGEPGADDEFVYDGRGRLVRHRRNGALLREWTYDANGNPLAEIRGSGPSQTTRSFTTNGLDQLVAAGDVTYTYDAAGRLQARQHGAEITQYAYDVLGNLVSVQLPDGRRIDYLVDAWNQRVRRTVTGGSARFQLFGPDGRLLADSTNGTAWRSFVYGSRATVPDYLRDGNTNFVLVHDHLGSVRRVVNASTGQVVQAIDYDAFGNVLVDTNPGFQPFGWAGGLYDHDTGLVRFGARDYFPEQMRWTARDPSLFGGGTTNLYEYCLGDPVNFLDPTGESPVLAITVVGALIGGAASGAIQVTANLALGRNWTSGLGGALAGGVVSGALAVWGAPLAGTAAVRLGFSNSGLVAGAISSVYGGAANAAGQVVNNAVEGNCLSDNVALAAGLGAVGSALTTSARFGHAGFREMRSSGLRPSSLAGYLGTRPKTARAIGSRASGRNAIRWYWAGLGVAGGIGSLGSFQ